MKFNCPDGIFWTQVMRDNLVVKFRDVGVAVDGSAGVKIMCISDSNHRYIWCYIENSRT